MIEFEEYFGSILDGKIIACDKMIVLGALRGACFLRPETGGKPADPGVSALDEQL